jgi:hypothetical protein
LDKSARRGKVAGTRTKGGKNQFILLGFEEEEKGYEHSG